MKVFTCIDHDCVWPVGGASVIVAPTARRARELLMIALKERGLDPTVEFTLQEVNLIKSHAIVLRDGEY